MGLKLLELLTKADGETSERITSNMLILVSVVRGEESFGQRGKETWYQGVKSSKQEEEQKDLWDTVCGIFEEI